MYLTFLIISIISNNLSLTANKIHTPPIIDGDIDSVWHYANSITAFNQCYPRGEVSSSESTIAKRWGQARMLACNYEPRFFIPLHSIQNDTFLSC